LKLRRPWNWSEFRQKLVLTPEEKRVIIFVLAAFVLGFGTKCYRDRHGQSERIIKATPTQSPGAKQKRARKSRQPTPTPSPE
jgi:hypothetical protein